MAILCLGAEREHGREHPGPFEQHQPGRVCVPAAGERPPVSAVESPDHDNDEEGSQSDNRYNELPTDSDPLADPRSPARNRHAVLILQWEDHSRLPLDVDADELPEAGRRSPEVVEVPVPPVDRGGENRPQDRSPNCRPGRRPLPADRQPGHE